MIVDLRADPWLAAIARARSELTQKTAGEIQRDTAYAWAARALVAYDRGWIADANAYGDEAAEHAALAELEGYSGLVEEIVSALKAARQQIPLVRSER